MGNNVIKRLWNKNALTNIEDLCGMLFQAEEAGHTFEIRGADGDGNEIMLSGTPSGVMLRPDGTDVALDCAVTDGAVTATLPAECYDVQGRFGLTVYLTSDGQKTAIYAAVGSVARTSSGNVSPGTTASVVDLINAIEAAIEQIPASDTNLKAALAPTYSTSAVYPAGSYAWYNGKLYRCTTAITSGETWNSAHWTEAKLGQDVSDLKSAIETEFEQITSSENRGVITPDISNTYYGVTYETQPDGTLKAYGQSTAVRRMLFLNGQNKVASSSTAFSKSLDPGIYTINFSATGYRQSVTLHYTETTFTPSVYFNLVSGRTYTFENPVMIGISQSDTADFGTENNPTYISFSAISMTACDKVARAQSENAVKYSEQALTTEQSNQARTNIDCVGNDTLYAYNFYEVLGLGGAESSATTNVSYTKNDDGSWTINTNVAIESLSFKNLVSSSQAIPRYIIPGRKYRLTFSGDTVPIQIFIYDQNGDSTITKYTEDSDVVFPTDMRGLIIRFYLAAGSYYSNVTGKYTLIPWTATSIDNHYTYNTTVEETVQEISNTYNATISPQITTDTNGWLQSVDTNTEDETGKTDMTSAIMAMLTSTGYCHLGEGIFYISGNIDMPQNSKLCGCGKSTILRLLSSVTSGYCIKMTYYCDVSDMMISGSYSGTSYAEQGTRTGILFAANDDGQEGTSAFDSEQCFIQNVRIHGFSDSGIKCHNSSMSVARGIYAVNMYIYYCWAGINIDYRSEFNKFVNICTSSCVYGCINNGGNNTFTSCTFGASSVGFYIDGTKHNAAHGAINGCTFCHIGSNNGLAFKAEGITAGYIVANCQIWYCGIEITNCQGVLFDGCEFGRGITNDGAVSASISVSGGNLVMFSGCMFHLDATRPPKITITNNSKTVFSGCYGTESGQLITP